MQTKVCFALIKNIKEAVVKYEDIQASKILYIFKS